MRTQNRSFRLTAALAVAGLLLAQLPPPAVAQATPPPPVSQQGDPPTRVGRLAQITGAVSFHTQDETSWNQAIPNYPVTTGNAFWTQPGARASIEVSASRIAMAAQTEFEVSNLTDTAFQSTVPQGEIYLRIRSAAPNEIYAVQTPRGLVTFSSPGRYGVVAGDTQNPTEVTVIQGSAHIEGPGITMDVAGNQTATMTGMDSFQGNIAPAQPDAFLTAMLNGERQTATPPPQVVASMPGGDDLSAYGTWSDTSDYGQVWYPQVAPDWVPYRDGQWAYVEPWGWTWVDSDPWGFAPFHYGRWVDTGGRWGWVPGASVEGPPVYAPALVTFIGVGAAVGVGIGAALAAGRIGWFPLGPREAYRPWYRASPTYLRNVNIRHVTNITTINQNVTVNNFINRRAATVVPTAAMTGSRPVGRFAQRVDPAQLAQARPLIGAQPMRPGATTVGVTPAVARQFNLPASASAGRPVAPGPAIRPMPVTARPVAPALHPPAQNAVPAAAAIHPAPPPGTPMLRPPPAPGRVGPPAIEHAAPAAAPGAVPHSVQPPTSATQPATVQPIIPQLHPGQRPETPALRAPSASGPVGPAGTEHTAPVAAPGAVPHSVPPPTGPTQPATVQPIVPQLHPGQRPETPALRAPSAPGRAGPPTIEHTAPVATPGAVPHTAQPPITTAQPVQPVVPQVHPMPVAPGAIQPQHIVPTPQAPVAHAPPPVQTPPPAVVHTPAPAAIRPP
ncbi:MAG TPA: DUF6600 domain-containing protein, partial [Acetobacteraceae bacterium]|nr:DUF6600 domain-containing protein [Acetobacteraceae bacterium]